MSHSGSWFWLALHRFEASSQSPDVLTLVVETFCIKNDFHVYFSEQCYFRDQFVCVCVCPHVCVKEREKESHDAIPKKENNRSISSYGGTVYSLKVVY